MRTDFTAGPDDHDRRLESVLRRLLPHQPLGALHKALRRGDVRLNGAKAAPEARVAAGDTVSVWDVLVSAAHEKKAPPAPKADLPRGWILYEGTDLVVLNKPSGLLVHRGDGAPAGGEAPLDDRVRAWLSSSASSSLSFRPGPLHRLDRETSGLVVFSRTLAGARSFSQAIADRRVTKTYLAVLTGLLDGSREVNTPLDRDEETLTTRTSDGGQTALTRFRPVATTAGGPGSVGPLTLAEVDLGTGRTHQIRAHARVLGHPLAGDLKYGGGPPPPGLPVPWLLHAWKLSCSLLPPLEAPFSVETAVWLKKIFKNFG